MTEKKDNHFKAEPATLFFEKLTKPNNNAIAAQDKEMQNRVDCEPEGCVPVGDCRPTGDCFPECCSPGNREDVVANCEPIDYHPTSNKALDDNNPKSIPKPNV